MSSNGVEILKTDASNKHLISTKAIVVDKNTI